MFSILVRQTDGSSESIAMPHKNRRSASRLTFAGENATGKEVHTTVKSQWLEHPELI